MKAVPCLQVISYRNYVNVVPDDPVEFRLEYRQVYLEQASSFVFVL